MKLDRMSRIAKRTPGRGREDRAEGGRKTTGAAKVPAGGVIAIGPAAMWAGEFDGASHNLEEGEKSGDRRRDFHNAQARRSATFISTILGPVGALSLADAMTPSSGAARPPTREIMSNPRKLWLTSLAAAGGMTIRALSNKAPSIFRAVTTVAAMSRAKA